MTSLTRISAAILIGLSFTLSGVGSASAAVIVYDSVGDTGTNSGTALNPATPYTVNLWGTGDIALTDFAVVVLQATGSVSITGFALDNGATSGWSGLANTAGLPGTVSFTMSNPVGSAANALVQLATITLNIGAGAGQLRVSSGQFVGSLGEEDFFAGGPQNLPAIVLVSVVPEPGTLLLLGSGLAGLLFLGRRK